VSTPKSVAGKWGPIAYAIAPVLDIEMLYQAAMDLSSEATSLHRAAMEKFRQWDEYADVKGADEVFSGCLWSEYEQLNREYWVLIGWYHMSYAAYLFAKNGCGSQYLDVTEIEVVALPDTDINR
jgi:hypothetical protein